jgi:hypothetical protein
MLSDYYYYYYYFVTFLIYSFREDMLQGIYEYVRCASTGNEVNEYCYT